MDAHACLKNEFTEDEKYQKSHALAQTASMYKQAAAELDVMTDIITFREGQHAVPYQVLSGWQV